MKQETKKLLEWFGVLAIGTLAWVTRGIWNIPAGKGKDLALFIAVMAVMIGCHLKIKEGNTARQDKVLLAGATATLLFGIWVIWG